MRAQSPGTSKTRRELIAEVAFWPARILLLAMLFASPWYYGSVTWQAQTYYLPVAVVILVLAIAGAVVKKEATGNPLVWSLVALLAMAMLQSVQMPDWLWQRVSASAAFERTTEEAQLAFQPVTARASKAEQIKIEDTPRTLSIHWVQTRASTAMFAIALACLVSGAVLFRTRNWELTLLVVLALSGLCIATLGLLQSVAWNKWTLLPMPTRSYFATFVSRNSAPQFLAIGLGAVLGLLAWWTGSKTDEADKKFYVRYPAINAVARFRRRLEELVADLDVISLICIISATLIFVTVLAAGSRGGILSCFAAAVLTLSVSLGTKKSYARTVGLVAIMACGAMLLLTTLELDSAILDRMDSVNEEAYKLNNGRILVWQMLLSQPSCWLPGCGLGNFHFAILPAYGEPTAWFYHAENIYLELLAEFGVIGFVIGITGLAWLVARIRKCVVTGRRSAPIFVATVLTVSAVGLQSLVDFSLILPSICLPLAVLVGCFIGRSYCSDFGKNPKRNERRQKDQIAKERASKERASKERAGKERAGKERAGKERASRRRKRSSSGLSNVASSLAILSLVLFAVWISAKPLSGFAFAEQLNSELNRLEKSAGEQPGQETELLKTGKLIESIDIAQVERFADHPEVNLQIGRLYQAFASEVFRKQLKWPADVNATQRAALSKPENIASAYRSPNDPRMLALRELASQMPQQIESLERSAKRMAAAASVCSFDWRSAWGVLRSDLDLFTAESRSRNYARLLKNTGQSVSLPASIGTAALIAGERQIGIRFLHDNLARLPKQVIAISTSVVDQLPAEASPAEAAKQLQLVLPDSPLLQAEVAEHFSRVAGRDEVSQQLASKIDLEDFFKQAEVAKAANPRDAKPWLLVAWLAKTRGETKTQLLALGNAISADPMNHAMRFEHARLLLADGQKAEAIQQAERASRLSPETIPYKAFLESARLGTAIP